MTSFWLVELDAVFLARDDDKRFHEVARLELADGLLFLCPKCLEENGFSAIGVHSCICWRPRVPQTTTPIPGRWEFQGSGLDDLTLVAGSSSILLTGGCHAHFFIRDGRIQW